MEDTESTDNSTKTKSTPQFNVRISEDLKHTIDEIGNITGKSKPDLLNEFVRVYQTKRSAEEFAEMDLTKYDNLSDPLKESVYNAFVHILNAVNGNLSTLKQSAIHLEDEKKGLTEREVAYKIEIESINSNSAIELLAHNEEREALKFEMDSQIELWKNKSIDLEAKNKELNKEFDNINKIAEQVQVITSENKELRESNRKGEAHHKAIQDELNDQLKSLSMELLESKQLVFKVEFEIDNTNKVIVTLKEDLLVEKKERADELNASENELLSISMELSDIKTEYNKALGKLEILEKK